MYYLAYIEKLQSAGAELHTALNYYSEWGVAVGLGVFASCMAAALLGFFIKSM